MMKEEFRIWWEMAGESPYMTANSINVCLTSIADEIDLA